MANEPVIRSQDKTPVIDLIKILASTCSQLLWSMSALRASRKQIHAALNRFDRLTQSLVAPNEEIGMKPTPLDLRRKEADSIYWRVWRRRVYGCPGFVEEDHNDFQRKFSGPLSLTTDLTDFEDGGSVATVQSLSALHGASMLKINDRARDGRTPLMLAAQWNRVGVMEALVAAGADPQACDSRGNSALHVASGMCHVGALKVLLRAGCDPFIQNRWVYVSG